MALGLTYPYCLKDGRLVSPEEVERGDRSLTCSGCTNRMLVRKGQIMVHHFAHYPDFEDICSGETALHRAAKQAIHDGFNDAKASGRKYVLLHVCLGCRNYYNYDLTDQADRVVLERSLEGSNIRPDITFLTGDGKPLITVEVVVTSPPSPETIEEYVRLEIPAFEVEPTWEGIKQFRTMHISGSHHKSDSVKVSINKLICLHCRTQSEELEKAFAEDEEASRQEKARQQALEDEEARREEERARKQEKQARLQAVAEAKQKAIEDEQRPILMLEHARLQESRLRQQASAEGWDEKETNRLIAESRSVTRCKLAIVDWFRKRNEAKQKCLFYWERTTGKGGFDLMGNSIAIDKRLARSVCPDITFSTIDDRPGRRRFGPGPRERITFQRAILCIVVIAPRNLTQEAIDEYTGLVGLQIGLVDPEMVNDTFLKKYNKVFCYRAFNLPGTNGFNPPPKW